jgi:hypothetical protein
MAETRTEALHELLIGVNKGMTTMLQALEIISEQLAAQIRATGGPALGLCGSHVAEWHTAGRDDLGDVVIPPAQTVFMVPGVGAVPVCLQHFQQFMASMSGPQLLVAQPGMPEPSRLVVPGR